MNTRESKSCTYSRPATNLKLRERPLTNLRGGLSGSSLGWRAAIAAVLALVVATASARLAKADISVSTALRLVSTTRPQTLLTNPPKTHCPALRLTFRRTGKFHSSSCRAARGRVPVGLGPDGRRKLRWSSEPLGARWRTWTAFVSERGSPFTTAGFARMIECAAARAVAHPHMPRHGCGYALANKGHDTRAIQGWLARRSITSTAALAGSRRLCIGIACTYLPALFSLPRGSIRRKIESASQALLDLLAAVANLLYGLLHCSGRAARLLCFIPYFVALPTGHTRPVLLAAACGFLRCRHRSPPLERLPAKERNSLSAVPEVHIRSCAVRSRGDRNP
jgi:hypothetical protein